MSRLIKESRDGWNLRHPSDPLDPETGDWGLVYAAILSFLRHAQSNYDAELASGADRERLRAQVTTAAKQKYSWLRLSRDPRAKKEETVVEKKALRPEIESHLTIGLRKRPFDSGQGGITKGIPARLQRAIGCDQFAAS